MASRRLGLGVCLVLDEAEVFVCGLSGCAILLGGLSGSGCGGSSRRLLHDVY